MQILYPSDDFISAIDIHRDEQECFQKNGFTTSIFDFNLFLEGRLSIEPMRQADDFALYRGWMLSAAEYNTLYNLAHAKHISLLTTPKQYNNCHFLPNWYVLLADYTPKTLFTSNLAELPNLYHSLNSNKVFVKDFVKSDTTGDSTATSIDEIEQIVKNILNFRAKIDGGICLRAFVDLDKSSEQRYFVFKKQAFSSNKDIPIPKMVRDIANKIDNPFFSVDTCYDINGRLWLIEIGDGQVSDLKNWQVDDFVNLFCQD